MEKLRKLIASVSLAALIASFGFTAVAQAATFSDVSEDHWAYEAVEQLAADGVVDVADTFRCNDEIQRSEFAKMVAESFGFDSSTEYDAGFSDVVAGAWYAGYINVLAQNGIMTGETDADGNPTGYVYPGENLNRAEAAKMVALAAGFELVTPTGDVFGDAGLTDWWTPYVETLYYNGVVVGDGAGSYLPGNDISRCEVAVMVYKAENPTVVDDTTTDDTTTDDTTTDDTTTDDTTTDDTTTDDTTTDDTVVETSDGSLTVALGEEVAGGTVAKGATHVVLMNVDFTASTEDVTVTGVTFARKGVGSSSDFTNLYVYQGDDRLTTGRTVSTSTNTVAFSSLNVDVAAGETVTLSLVADYYTSATAANEDYFEVESTDAVTHNGVSTEGDFPLTGESFSISGQAAGTITISKYGSLSNPTVGEQDAEIAKFQLVAATEDTWINQISLRVRGSISSSLVTNFVLKNGSTEIATVEELNSSDLMVFVLDTPIEVESGGTETFTVTADIGAADADDTVLVDLDENADLIAIGEVYGYGSAVTSTSYDGGDGTSTSSCTGWTDASCTTVEGGQITIAFNGPVASDVAVNQKDVELFDFSMTAQSDVEVRKLTFSLTCTTSDAGGLVQDTTTDVANFTDIKIVDTDTGEIVGSPQDVSVTGNDGTQSFNYTDTFYIDAAETRNFTIKADIASNASLDAQTVSVSMSAVSTSEGIRDIDTGEYVTDIVPSSTITGNSMTVKTASLAISLSSSPTDQTVVKGTDDVEAVGFAFTAGSASDVKVTSVKLTGYVDLSTAATSDGDPDGVFAAAATGEYDDGGTTAYKIGDVVASVKLYDGDGNEVSSKSETFNSSGEANFTGLSWTITAGQTEKLVPVVTVDKTSTPRGTGNDNFALDIHDVSADISCEDEDGNTVVAANDDVNGATSPSIVIGVKSAGTITIAASDDPVLDDAAIAGTDSSSDPLLVARYKVYSTAEAFTVSELQFINDSGADNSYEDSDAISTVILKYPTSLSAPDTLDGTASVTLVSGAYSFIGLNMAVPKSENTDDNAVDVEVYVTTNAITSTGSFSSGAQIEMDFDEGDGFKAVGQGSGTTITDASASTLFGTTSDVDANEIALYQALPTFAYHSGTSQCSESLTGSSTDKVYCFSVTATGGAVALYSLEFAASPNLLTTTTAAGALGVTSGWTITEYDSSGLVGSSLGSGTWTSSSNTVAIAFSEAPNDEEIIAKGSTAYYVVQAPITYTDSTDTSSLSVYLQQDTAYIASTGASSVTSGTNIVWSDRSASSHSTSTADWTGGYKLETLPTTTLRSAE